MPDTRAPGSNKHPACARTSVLQNVPKTRSCPQVDPVGLSWSTSKLSASQTADRPCKNVTKHEHRYPAPAQVSALLARLRTLSRSALQSPHCACGCGPTSTLSNVLSCARSPANIQHTNASLADDLYWPPSSPANTEEQHGLSAVPDRRSKRAANPTVLHVQLHFCRSWDAVGEPLAPCG